jgi:hypothetical protein
VGNGLSTSQVDCPVMDRFRRRGERLGTTVVSGKIEDSEVRDEADVVKIAAENLIRKMCGWRRKLGLSLRPAGNRGVSLVVLDEINECHQPWQARSGESG